IHPPLSKSRIDWPSSQIRLASRTILFSLQDMISPPSRTATGHRYTFMIAQQGTPPLRHTKVHSRIIIPAHPRSLTQAKPSSARQSPNGLRNTNYGWTVPAKERSPLQLQGMSRANIYLCMG